MNKLHATLIAGILIGLVVGASVVLVANPVPPSNSDYRIGLVLATGGLGDKSINDLAYAGAVRARELLRASFDYVEPASEADFESFQTNFAKSVVYDLIVCVGFNQADALNKTAAIYPNQKFALIDGVVSQPNVASLTFKANERAFLAVR
jgi:basic membrane protein A and related proteins